MRLSLPFDLINKIPDLLESIEINKKSIGVDSYGVSSPTIEEIFIRYA